MNLASFLFSVFFISAVSLHASTTEFYFIRHGETEVNKEASRIGGESAWAELTERGKDQALALGHHLQDVEFDAYYTSDVIRTQQTARYFFEAKGILYQRITRDHRLTEQSQGDWEGRIRAEIYTSEIKSQLGWTFIPGDKVKGESQQQVAERMVRWIKEKANEHLNQRLIVFSHGLAIRYLVADLLNLNRETAYTIPIANTSLTVIRFEDNAISCPILNNTSHLKFDCHQSSECIPSLARVERPD